MYVYPVYVPCMYTLYMYPVYIPCICTPLMYNIGEINEHKVKKTFRFLF